MSASWILVSHSTILLLYAGLVFHGECKNVIHGHRGGAITVGVTPGGDPEPEFHGPIQNVTIAVGREAVLTCSVEDLGNYKVGWMRAEDQTILSLHTRVVTHNSRVTVSHDGANTWQLHIRPLRETDRGCYMCQINTSTMKKQLGCIDVHVPPDIVDSGTSGDVVVREGENTFLSCKAEGKPTPRIIWRREDGGHIILRNQSGDATKGPESVNNRRNSREATNGECWRFRRTIIRKSRAEMFAGETLHLLRVDRKQLGAYLCIASNDVPPSVSKRIILQVVFSPTVLVANRLIGVPSGSDAVLECFVEAFPATVNYWTKNRDDVLLEGTGYSMKEERLSTYQHRMTLTIGNFDKDDHGTYTCTSTNTIGKGDGTVRVYEIKTTTTTTTTTTTSTTTTTTSTTTSTTTPPPSTTTEQANNYPLSDFAVPLPPAEQKVLQDDKAVPDAANNNVQSVSYGTWLITENPYYHNDYSFSNGASRCNVRLISIITATLFLISIYSR